MKPRARMVLLDQTDMWNPEFLEGLRAPRMYGFYAYKPGRNVHCCEVNPTYELHFIRNIPVNPADGARRAPIAA